MDNCIFCRIIQRQIPAKIIYEDDHAMAFEDANPQAPAHVLVVPRQHLPSLKESGPDDEAALGHLLTVAAQVARDKHLEAKGYRVVINNGAEAGQTVFHLHAHVLGGRVFHWPPG
jgi:histidine triad (HIT) family protein